jgi:Na+/melibiose symporter-like transporter
MSATPGSLDAAAAPSRARLRGFPARLRIGYGVGSFVTGSFGTVPGLLLLPYLTDTLGVAAGLAGLLVLAPKAWDVMLNPVVGRISDNTHGRWGARRPYLLAGGLVLAVLFASIFAGVYTGLAGAVWVTCAFVASATAFSFFQVPYSAMPAEMTEGADLADPYTERTRMMTWRIAFLAAAILVSGAVSPLVVDHFGGGVRGYRAMGIFIATLIVAGTIAVFVVTHGAPAGRFQESEPNLRAQLRVAASNRPFMVLVACFVVQAAGVAAMLAGVQYFARYVMGDEHTTTLLFTCVVSPALVVMPAWNRVADRLGKLRGYVIASLMITITTFAMVASKWLPSIAVYGLVVILGVGYAGQQLFGLAMLPDCINYDSQRTGKRQAGVFTGLWTAGETLGLALGPGIFGGVLQLFGYVSATPAHPVAQTPLAQLGVLIGFTVVPGIVVGLALLFLRAYDLPSERSIDLSSAAPAAG